MRPQRVRFTIQRLMTVVAVSALVLTPFAWTSPGSRWPFFIGVVTVGSMVLIVASPFLLDWLGETRGSALAPRPHVKVRRPLPLAPSEPDPSWPEPQTDEP